jgi:5'-nucleotidase
LFLEKIAMFPIINANLYIKPSHTRLFKPHYIKEVDGMKILFIGIITEEVLSKVAGDKMISTFV